MPDPQFTQEQLANEEWLPIVDWENWYSISTLGRWRREITATSGVAGHIGTPCYDGAGYVVVRLSQPGRRFHGRVHRLVAAAFLGPCPKGFEVNHINGVKSDNRLVNLEYRTRRGNQHHMRHVLGKGRSSVSVEMFTELIILRYAGWSCPEIGRRLGLSVPYVWQLFTGTGISAETTSGRSITPAPSIA